MEIMYDKGSGFIGHKFIKYITEKEYGITAKTRTSGNPTSNAILERIHHILGNLVQNYNIKNTYVDWDDPGSSILASAAFAIRST